MHLPLLSGWRVVGGEGRERVEGKGERGGEEKGEGERGGKGEGRVPN